MFQQSKETGKTDANDYPGSMTGGDGDAGR
jgi:hypothetical protein